VAIALQNLELAEEYAGRSLSLRRRINDTDGVADALRTLAWASIEARDFKTADERLSESIQLTLGIGDRRGISEALELYALLASDRGQFRRAVELFSSAAQIRRNFDYAPRVRVLRREAALEAAKQQITEQEYARAWRRGASLELSDAVAAGLHAPEA
jgi:tetratricopeptide (TPR) repeat protein